MLAKRLLHQFNQSTNAAVRTQPPIEREAGHLSAALVFVGRSVPRRATTLWTTALAVLAIVLVAPAMALADEALANNSATVVNQTGVRQGVYRRLFDAPGAVYSHRWYEDTEAAKRIEIVAEEGSRHYDFDFGAPMGQQLHVGEYTGATSDIGTEGPLLEVSGEGAGCNQSFGRFIVKDIHIDEAGEVDRFWALYEFHCENPNWPATFGEVRIGEPATEAPEAIEPSAVEWPRTWVGETSVSVPVAVVAGHSGADVTSVAVAGEEAGDFRIVSDECLDLALAPGERCQLEVAAVPAAPGDRAANLVITDSSGSETAIPLAVVAEQALRVNYATLVSEQGSWVGEGSDYLFDKPRELFMEPALWHGVLINSEAGESSSFEFQPIGENQLELGEYNGALRSGSHPETSPGLSVGYMGHGCNTENGHFVVKDIDRNAGGEVDRFRALYEDHCESSGAPAVFGEVSVGEPATSAPEAVRPAEVEWPITQVGQATVPVPITVAAGETGAEVQSISLEGAAASDFQVINDGCLSVPLALNGRCQLDLLAEPSTSGSRTAQLVIVDDSGASTVVPLEVFAERSQELAGAPSYEFLKQNPIGGKVYKIGKSVTVSFHLAAGGRADELETPTLQIAPETGYEAGDYRPATSVTNRGDIFTSVKHGNYRYRLQTAGLSAGPWMLRIKLDDGKTHTTRITLR